MYNKEMVQDPDVKKSRSSQSVGYALDVTSTILLCLQEFSV